MRLETLRLVLEPLTRQYTGPLARTYSDPDAARYIGGGALDAEGTAPQVGRFEAVWREHGWG